MIYKDKRGQRYIALSDEDLEILEWNPKKLLELDHDGVGWIIRPSSISFSKVITNESKRN